MSLENPPQRNGRTPAATRPPKRSDLIADELRHEIVEGLVAGTLTVGSQLPPEKQLLERFDVARPTLREAMRIVEAHGLLEFRVGARGGAYVRRPSTKAVASQLAVLLQLRHTTLRDAWRVRAELEPIAVSMVAVSTTPDGIARLRSIVERAAAVTDDDYAWGTVTVAFHRELMEQSGNTTLSVLASVLRNVVEAQQSVAAAVAGTGAKSLRTAEERREGNDKATRSMAKLVRLLESGDPRQAEAFWRVHLEVLGTFMLELLGETELIEVL